MTKPVDRPQERSTTEAIQQYEQIQTLLQEQKNSEARALAEQIECATLRNMSRVLIERSKPITQ